MKVVIFVRMTAAGTVIKLIDRDTGEIIDELRDAATDGNELPRIVLDASAYAHETYAPERIYYDVERGERS